MSNAVSEVVGEFTRRIEFNPAWDRHHSDPNKNYGVHGVDLGFYLIGPRGAVQFRIFTNWQLRHIQDEQDSRTLDRQFPHLLCHPMPADLGYHSRVRMYPSQEPISEDCPIIGGMCYYDGSSLAAEEVYWEWVEKGMDWLWERLERAYYSMLEDSGE